MKRLDVVRGWARSGIAATLLGLCLAGAGAVPAIDGVRDAEYTLVSSSAEGNLLVRPANSINDNTDPMTRVLDLTNLYAANTGSALYLYIEMPHLDLDTVYGEWAVVMHLGGANDAIVKATPGDPYGAAVTYAHTPAMNVVLKSNMRGFKGDEAGGDDGNQGWAELVRAGPGGADWAWGVGNFLFAQRYEEDVPNKTIHGWGNSGGEVVYKGASGTTPGAIEVRIPFDLFEAGNPTDITAPKPGDPVKFQVYTNFRVDSGGIVYPRGPIDAVPFQESMWDVPESGTISLWGDYTMTTPATLELSDVKATGLSEVQVTFNNLVGDGAATAGNYVLTNLDTNVAVPVATAVVDPQNSARVNLTVPNLPLGTRLRLVVSNVKSTAGTLISPDKATMEFQTFSGVVFHLYDPLDLVGAIPTTLPFKVTLTGSLIGWANNETGSNEIQMNPVAGEPGHYRSDPIMVAPGRIWYKYRVPGADVPNVWDYLNYTQPDRQFDVPNS